jgi:predicted nucleotide-binding protein
LKGVFAKVGARLDDSGELFWDAGDASSADSASTSTPVIVAARDKATSATQSKPANSATRKEVPVVANSVFLVHGHDVALRERVSNRLYRWGLEPIVLADKANAGHTLVEKFEKHAATATFAIILASPDDVGAAKGDASNLQPRARQNVILEMGYFFAHLGRGHVAVLNGGIEKPSDIDGLVYIPAAAPDWEAQLGRELAAAGYALDWTR